MPDALRRAAAHIARRTSRLLHPVRTRMARTAGIRRRERIVRDVHDHMRSLGLDSTAVVLYTDDAGQSHIRTIAGPIDSYDLYRMAESAHDRRRLRHTLVPEQP